MQYIQVNNLNFQEIKTSLKEYLRAQTDFTDFDFEGSVWSNLLDVLAYNTYYTAFNTNMVVNELFLNSATLRDNVIAIAKQLGYFPKSAVAPQSVVSFDVTFNSTSPANIILKRGTGLITSFDDSLYKYVVVDDIKVPVINNTASFSNISVYEGNIITDSYTVNNGLSSQRFILRNPGTDVSSIRVKVYPFEGATFFEYYDQVTNILDVNSTSKVFYVEEIEDEQYEMFFGDGVLGRKLQNNEFIEISYLVTSGDTTNGARLFTFSGVLSDEQGNVGYQVSVGQITTNSVASGGALIESVEKIKFNAPKQFSTQNRAVTSADYAAIVRKIYPAVSDIIVYGGEDEQPPEYGKVKIVIKPESGSSLSGFTKSQILSELKQFCVASVTPEIKDPSVVYIELTSNVFYDTKKTNQFSQEIRSKVISAVDNYTKLSGTEKFNGKFRFSKYSAVIDEADVSINSNTTTLELRKDFYPILNSSTYYELCFLNPFKTNCDFITLKSTGFITSENPTYVSYLEDRDGTIVIYRIDPITGDKIVLNNDIGTIDYAKGEIMLNDLTIIKGSFFDNRIEIRVTPANNDIFALREMFLDVDISNSKFTVYAE
jgi:hypothetical protein